MAINFTWQFSNFKVKPSLDELEDVLVSYEWRRGAKDGEYFIDCYGLLSLSDPDRDSFKDYETLTKDDIINWTISKLTQETVDNYDLSLVSQIENLKNPPLITKPVPWSRIK
jgi:hypothetical protein